MLKKILNKREKIVLYIAGVVIISAVVFRFVIYPLAMKYSVLSQDIRVTRARLIKYMQILNQKDDLQNKYSEFSANLKLSQQPQDTYVGVLSELENLAKLSNIRITDVRPQDKLGETAKKEAIVDLRTEGVLEDYMKFIYNIETSLWLLRIKKLQLSAKSNTNKLEGSFTIYQLSVPSI